MYHGDPQVPNQGNRPFCFVLKIAQSIAYYSSIHLVMLDLKDCSCILLSLIAASSRTKLDSTLSGQTITLHNQFSIYTDNMTITQHEFEVCLLNLSKGYMHCVSKQEYIPAN